VFCTADGTPLNYKNLHSRMLKPAAEEAGVGWAAFHTLRHTCASRLFAAGRNAVQVQRWLGHHSPAFTLTVYVHLLDGGLGEPIALPACQQVSAQATESDGIAREAEVAIAA
jgi:integrase